MVIRNASAAALAALALWLTGCANHAQTTSGAANASGGTAASTSQSVAVGNVAPAFTYRLIDGGSLSASALRGHPYMVWIMATWCSSCQGGTEVVAQHITQLRARDVRVVQLEAADNLGNPGPPLSAFRAASGMAASSPNWYWGEATAAQMRALDPNAYPDIYYLVNRQGRVVEVNGAPAATWSEIAKFANDSVSGLVNS